MPTDGQNRVPAIHIDDLISVLEVFARQLPPKPYVFVTDAACHTMMEIAQVGIVHG